MTRVALLPSSYPPSLGGVEELTRHLALSLVAAGDQVEVWTGRPDDSAPEGVEILDGIVVRRLPLPLPASNLSALLRTATVGTRSVVALRRAVAAFRPDVLHVQCFGPNGAYATLLGALTALPLVVTLQGETVMDDSDIFETSSTLRRALRVGLSRAAAVTACSAFTLDDAHARFGLEPDRGEVIPNGVDLAAPDPAGDGSAPARRAGGRPYLLALGRVEQKKGFDLLLEAYAAMDPAERAFDVVIAGDGSAVDGLRRRVASLGLDDRVELVGRLSRQDVATTMAGAGLFVMPSRVEPFGIVVLEAWRAAVPVVATNRGGPPELVHDGEDGLLVDPFDTAGFARVLAGALADPERLAVLGAAGRARVAEFDWPVVAGRYRAVYAEVSPPHRGTAPAPARAAAAGVTR